MTLTERLIEQVGDTLLDYDVYPGELQRVLVDAVSFEERQQRAIAFIERVLTNHGKRALLGHVSRLAAVEHGIRELQPRQRDHVVHAVRVFLLGMYLNKFYMGHHAVAPFRWKLAGLTHDVGYPMEIASRVASPFAEELNRNAGLPNVDIEPVRYRAPRLEGLEQLTGKRNSITILQDRLHRWGLQIDAAQVYQQRTQEGAVCHGIISALSVLRVVDILYNKNNPRREFATTIVDDVDWNEEWFAEDNVDACAAIFLHNLEGERFHAAPITREHAPIAFLLRLADTLQEWERPSGNNPDGVPSDQFDIDAHDGHVVFTANIPDAVKQGLRHVLDQTLAHHNVTIQ